MADYAGMARKVMSLIPGIRAYHGSPYKFDKFSTQHIGGGEGAQAYGHGLYFAEREPVALTYKNAPRVTDMNWPVSGTEHSVPAWVARGAQSSPQRLDEIRLDFAQRVRDAQAAGAAGDWNQASNVAGLQHIVDALDAVKAGRGKLEQPGHMYEVNIRARPEQFLDWDRPLKDQSPQTARLATSLAERYRYAPGEPAAVASASGEQIARYLAHPDVLGHIDASKALRDAGIPGIRYADQGSRGAYMVARRDSDWGVLRPDQNWTPFRHGERSLAEAEAARLNDFNRTSNYVVNDDSLIDILRRYGIMAGIAPPAAAAALGGGDGGQ